MKERLKESWFPGWFVLGTDINVTVGGAGFIAGNTGGCNNSPPVRTHPVKRKRKSTGTCHPPNIITWNIHIQVHPLRVIQPGVISVPNSTVPELQLYSLAMTLAVKIEKRKTSIYHTKNTIGNSGHGHLGIVIPS